jgi:hypothetical protein
MDRVSKQQIMLQCFDLAIWWSYYELLVMKIEKM